jgi:SAM-dependent methyltransferase
MDDELEQRLTRLESLTKLTSRALIQAKYTALDNWYDSTLAGRVLRCILCGYEAIRETFTMRISRCQFAGGKLERYDCPRCHAVFGPMKMLDMAPAELDDEYRLLYSAYTEADRTERELRTFDSLSPSPGKLYLNWGCGGIWSHSVRALRAQGWDVWGYEPYADTSGNHVVQSRGEISAQFDGIFSNNVIEHFRDPVAAFRDFANILKADGLMAHSTPCYEWLFDDTRFHTIFYLDESIYHLAELTGFEVLNRETDGQYSNTLFRKRT